MSDAKKQPEWRRSNRCASGACIEVAKSGSNYLIRDSKNPDVELTFTTEEWAAFSTGVVAGDFHFE
jgi:hypothetical protein